MEIKSKLQTFHSSIRKAQHDSFFHQRRIKILQQLDRQQSIMEEQFSPIHHPKHLTIQDLIKAAKFSQSESGIIILKTADYQNLVLEYLGDQYINSQEQYFASYILCNLFYIRQAPPKQETTQKVLHLIKNGQKKTIQNCLAMLEHTLLDFPDWRDEVVKQYGLMDKLRPLFTMSNLTKKCLRTLLMVIHHALYKAKPHQSFKNIKKSLGQIIIHIQIEDFQILKIAMHSLQTLSVIYPEDTAKFINQTSIIPRLIHIIFTLNDRGLILLALNFIRTCLSTMQSTIFIQKIIPFLRAMEQKRYEYGKSDSIYSITKIQIQAYDIINEALETLKLDSQIFFKDSLAFLMLETLQSTENQDIIDSLVPIFSIVFLNITNQQGKARIDQVLLRIRQKCSNNFQLMAYLQQIDGLKDHV